MSKTFALLWKTLKNSVILSNLKGFETKIVQKGDVLFLVYRMHLTMGLESLFRYSEADLRSVLHTE